MVLLYHLVRGNLNAGVYHLFGGGATGKTTIAMSCAAGIAARGSPVAWIDARGGFSPARFAEISTSTTGKNHSNRILLNKAGNPLALDNALQLLQQHVSKWQPGLVVLDTAFGTFDQALADPVLRRVVWMQAREQLARLVLLCNANRLPLLLVNGVGYKPGQDQERPTGEAVIAPFTPECALVHHVIGPRGKTGKMRYVSCDDETTYFITSAGITVNSASVAGRKPCLDEEDEEAMEA